MAIIGFIPCGLGQSFFKLIERLWQGERPAYTLHRICTLMRKMGAQTIVHEALDKSAPEWHRIRRELDSIRTRLGRDISSKVEKLTFVTKGIRNDNDLDSLRATDFLGYCILLSLDLQDAKLNFIFESVIGELGILSNSLNPELPRRPLLNNYLHVKKTFSCTVGPHKRYRLIGNYFCQQNTINSVCAHACAAMILNNCKETKHIVSCEDINGVVGIDQKKRMLRTQYGKNDKATQEGLSIMELQAVFRNFGFSTYRLNLRPEENRGRYRDFLYSFVESGYPAVLSFTTSGDEEGPIPHVVPVFGHTLNSDSWFPTAFAGYVGRAVEDKPYLSTLDWVADFIVNDDNFGMYFSLPTHTFRPEGHPDPGMNFRPLDAIGIYPLVRDVRLLLLFVIAKGPTAFCR